MSSEGSRPADPAGGTLSPDAVAGKRFAAARKGYDRAEVRNFLSEAAAALAAATGRIVDLERRLAREAAASDAAGLAEGIGDEILLEAISAEAWRDEVLSDLDRRRRELNAEVMRLRAGRDLLREDIAGVADALTEQMRRLDGSLRAARSAGDLEEQRIRSEGALSDEERRAELQAARLAGFVTADGRRPEPSEQEAEPTSQAPEAGEDEAAPDPSTAVGQADDIFARLRAEGTGAAG